MFQVVGAGSAYAIAWKVAPTAFGEMTRKCVFRKSVTGRFGIVTAEFGNVTDHFGDVTDGVFVTA